MSEKVKMEQFNKWHYKIVENVITAIREYFDLQGSYSHGNAEKYIIRRRHSDGNNKM